MSKKECPNCKVSVSDIAADCECGYKFVGYEDKTLDKSKSENYVIIKDVQMSFGSMVEFMVKWSIASIPAMIILMIIGFLVSAFIVGIFGLKF